MIRRAFLLCALALCARADRVALISFQRVAIPQDVPAHLCSAIAQDHEGLLWFGTQGGLVRYDGFEFRVFRSNAGDQSTIAGNYVRALLVASDGRLWVGTFSGGLSVYDPRTETFTRYQHDPRDPRTLAYDRVEGLAETRDGSIWIATTAGLDRLDPKSGRIEHFNHDADDPKSLADDRVRGLLADREGRLWVGTRDGLQRLDGDHFTRAGLDGQYVIKLFEDARGRIWIGTEEHGAAVLDPKSGAITRLLPRPENPNGLSHYWVYGFAEGAAGEMWIATFGGGIDVVDEASLAIIDRLQADPLLEDALHDNRTGAIFRDRGGVVWVGTWGDGIVRHDPRTRAFRSLRFSPNRADGLTHRAVVRAMEMRDGTIWAGTNGNGIDVLDRDLHRIGGFRAGALSDGSITCLAQSDDGTIWVATLNSMLHRLRPGATTGGAAAASAAVFSRDAGGRERPPLHRGATATFERIGVDKLPGGPIRTIAFTGDGMVWAGAAEGMVRIDPATMETRVYRSWPGAAKSSPAIESIVDARDGTLWVGTDNGLYSFDRGSEAIVRIARDPSVRGALPDNWVPDLLIARDGRLWAGTAGGAAVLAEWNGRVAHFDNLATKLSRAPSAAEELIEDADGMLWVGPRLRVDPRNWTAREFASADGVAFRNFFIASRARMRDGRLLFGSPEGLLIVDPSKIAPVSAVVPIVATGLRVEGNARAGAAVLHALTLTPAERSFTLDVAALDYTSSTRRRYRYKLEGLDADWTTAGESQRSITYSRLPPGTYTLFVGATNARELRLPITVLPAFYQTLWFRALAALAFAALMYGAYRLRVRQIRARAAELEVLVAERTSELSAAYERIEEASLTDPLTRLRNRRYLEQTIGADLELAARGEGDLVVMLVDLDHFKSVNDKHGHAAGDAVLAELARVLKRSVRASDMIVRWGGEEFLIVIRFVDRALAPELAEKVRANVAAHEFPIPDGTILRRTCSIGATVWPFSRAANRAVAFEHVVDIADIALYSAKRSGRDAWVTVACGESDPAAAADQFRSDAGAAVGRGMVVVQSSAQALEIAI